MARPGQKNLDCGLRELLLRRRASRCFFMLLAGVSGASARLTGSRSENPAVDARKLADITDNLPAMTELYLSGSLGSVQCNPVVCASAKPLYAGVTYTSVELRAPGADTFNVSKPGLKVVKKDMNRYQAQNGLCRSGSFVIDDRQVGAKWSNGVEALPDGSRLRANEALHFIMGGLYRLCYSEDGSFGVGKADVAPVWMVVSGVFDLSASCNSPTCLTHRKYHCYLKKLAFNTQSEEYSAATSCVVDFSYADAGFHGTAGKGSWSAEFTASGYHRVSGKVLGVQTSACGSSPATFICRDGGACDSGDRFIDLNIPASNKGQYSIPTVSNDLTGSSGIKAYRARTVAACYCPDISSCSSSSSFVQQVGVIHFYLSKVCHAGDAGCSQHYSGVVAQYRFRVRVECPTDACLPDRENRIKLVAQTAANDRPSWDSVAGCRSAVHGLLNNVQTLPSKQYVPVDGSMGGTVNPDNCGGPLDCHLSGGARQDYKEFGGPFGFQFVMGASDHEARNFHQSHNVDVCYCNAGCTVGNNWFQVGAFRVSPTRLVSAATSRSNSPAQWSIEFVNQPGTLGLYRPYADSDTLGLQEDSLLKIVTDEERVIDDDGCAISGYDSQLTSGLSNDVAASMNYLGKRQTQTPPDLQKIVFNSDAFVNTLAIQRGGAIAICYCAVTVDSMCIDRSNWKLVTRVTIKGPKFQQRWSFSTNVVFRFSYEGYGLTDNDTLRIISSDGRCTDNNFNPNTAAFAYTSLSVGCPVPCTPVGTVKDVVKGDLSTKVLSDDNYQCDHQNSNCQINDIEAITVISEIETELTFQKPHGLEDGQEITLTKNIACDHLDPTCTPEMVAALRGVVDYADGSSKNAQAPDTYMLAHRVRTTANLRKVRLPIGWPEPKPRFSIIFANARPEIGYIGRGGKWTMHSRAIIKEEVLGTRERANLRVCWRYGGNGAKYVAEVGRMDIREPPAMVGATLSLSTTLRNTLAPMIFAFRTASGVTGLRYDEAQDSLRLKLVFTATDLVDITYADINGSVIPDVDVTTEDDAAEAKQSTCGKLFLELWSDDMQRGFPLPKGCYYKTYASAKRREFYMLFEAKNGLRKDTTYQIVFNGRVKEEIPINAGPNFQPSVRAGGEYMEVFPMDDVVARPYEAIERGIVRLTSEPQAPGRDVSDPKFLDPDGFKIVGGHQNLLELNSGDSVIAELMGDPNSGKIEANMIIRIYLWPLLQWQTTSSCTAECLAGFETSFLCGPITSCRGQALVPGMSLNTLKITLPSVFESLFGNKKVRMKIGGITMPSGGYFANRWGVQVTKSDDSNPHYVVSVGDCMWKQPNIGQPLSRVVSKSGGGNAQPFRGDKDNILYARLILSSTILAQSRFGRDASLILTLPAGYTCVDKNPFQAYGENAWAVEDTLPVFQGVVPQGRGTPSDGTASHGWSVQKNICTFTPAHPHGVLYAGSSVMIKIYADNPQHALPRTVASNMWTVQYQGRGLHPSINRTTRPYPFSSSGDSSYQMNYAVLGRITDAACQPTNFDQSARRAVQQELRFFFRVEQEVGEGGALRLEAPLGFEFVDPCNATHLEASYYSTGSDPGDATLPLPGIVSCQAVNGSSHVVQIRMRNMLAAGRLFGFKIWVTNPQGFDTAQRAGWLIYTSDAAGFLMDGTPKSVSFTSGDDESWGVYNKNSMQASLSISNMLPFEMTGNRATVSVVLRNVPTGKSGYTRLVAPHGFVWNFQSQDYVSPTSQDVFVPAGVTAPFPAGVPTRSGSDTLIWAPAFFFASQTYGFAAHIQVPRQGPTSSSNSFFLELGFNSTGSERLGAITMPAPRVRALQNARVDYTTNIKMNENSLQFRLETITHIPAGGGLEIGVPSDFRFANPCEVLPALDTTAPAAPNFTCEPKVYTNSGPQGRLVLLLRTGAEGLAPGLHFFSIIAANPFHTVWNYPTDSPCGTYVCWLFKSLQFLPSTSDSSGVSGTGDLDLETSAQGFDINNKMLEARLPIISEAQRRGSGRDDRPLQPNSVIFAFMLDKDATTSGPLILRGPHGFYFAQSCLSGVEYSEAKVFGTGNRFPPGYEVWPAGVKMTDCFGSGSTANITVTFEPGRELLRGKLYIFRIGLTSNPATTPIRNWWTAEFNGESAEPFEGMTLWAFTDTKLVATSTARDRTLAGSSRTRNPLRIHLRPFNTVPSDGILAVEVPLGFIFVHLPSMECEAELQELPYQELGVDYPGYVWLNSGLVCLVDENSDSGRATIRLKDPRPMSAGLQHLLTVTVYNPRVAFQTGPTVWKVSSFLPSGLPLDQSSISAFVVNSAMNLWTYTNPDPENPSTELRNGGVVLPSFTLQMRFPDELAYGDEILIEALAEEFVLIDVVGRCRGLRWIGHSDPTWQGPLPNSPVTCDKNSLHIRIQEATPVARDVLIQIGLKISNPLRTPTKATNAWRCTHRGPATSSQAVGPIKSSAAFQSWDIIPQFENVQVQLLGPRYAAESVSSIRIEFVVVTDAEDLAIQAKTPPKFDFNGASVLAKDQEIFLVDGPLIRIRCRLKQGQRVAIVLSGVRLGRQGGQTNFQLTSWTGGIWQSGEWQPGEKQDEKLNFISGFRLPGRTILSYEKLENDYHRDPVVYPVQAGWEALMSRPCYLEFQFQLTQTGQVGHFLRISGRPYEATMRTFYVEKLPELTATSSVSGATGEQVAVELTDVRRSELRARLLQPLEPYTVYKTVLSVIAPSAQAVLDYGGPIRWTIETFDDGALPVNTNDGMSREFPIVEQYRFRVQAVRAPPMADITVQLHVVPHISAPSELKVVAPEGFNFSAANCLVSGGDDVISCTPTMPVAGRSAATLICKETGLRAPPADLRIRVTTPRADPLLKSWFIEGIDGNSEAQLGWGEADGLVIRMMPDTYVSFPGIPFLPQWMVWRFRTEMVVQSGGWLEVALPKGYRTNCNGRSFNPIALPSSGGCNAADPERVIVFLNSTMVPSEYVFALTVEAPEATPLANIVSLTLKDHRGNVQDGSIDLPAPLIKDKLQIEQDELIWTESRQDRPSEITVGFTALDTLPDNVVAPDQQVQEILITFPSGFVHLVESPLDFIRENEDMPFAQPEWLDYMQKDRLRVILNLNQTAWLTLRSGSYRFRFPVLVPNQLPIFNVWQLSLCRSDRGPCNSPTAPAVVVNFAYAGFKIGQPWESVYTTTPAIGEVQSGSQRCRNSGLALAAWSFVAAAVLLRLPPRCA